MRNTTNPTEFYGVLGRITMHDGGAELRFYPFVFSATPDAKCVFVVKFDDKKFPEDRITALIDAEVEVTVFADRAEVFVIFDGANPIVLPAGSVNAVWSVYDHQDLMEHAIKLNDEYERLNLRLTKAVRKDRKGLQLTQEMMRRATIKAAASDELKTRQAAVIAVMERLMTHFESDD